MSYSSMILLQIGCEFLDACSGENNGVAAQVLTAGGITRNRARGVGTAYARRSGFASVIHAPVIAAPNRCYDYQISHGARKNTDLVSVSRVRFFYRATLY